MIKKNVLVEFRYNNDVQILWVRFDWSSHLKDVV